MSNNYILAYLIFDLKQLESLIRYMNSVYPGYSRLQKIGEGTYGLVYAAISIRTAQKVAIKRLKMDHRDQGIPSTALRQISLLMRLNHPNIIRCLSYQDPDQKNLFMTFQFMQMDLRKFLQNHKRNIDHSLAKSFIKQLLSALEYCHSCGVLHRDIKPHNILIKDSTIKLADFGLARATGLQQKSMSRQIETLWYRAPEVLLGNRRYGQGVDIWAAGCIYVQLLGGKPLFQGDSQFGQIIKIFQIFGTPNSNLNKSIFNCPDFKIDFPKFKEQGLREVLVWMHPNDFDICSKMLALAPEQRLSARRLLQQPYFANL